MINKVVAKFGLALIILGCLVAPFFPADIVMADTAQPTSVSIHDIKVYNSLISLNDTLFVIPYNIPYGVLPTNAIDKNFIFSLMDGVNLLGSVTAYPYASLGYGQGCVSFYFSANSSIVWGSAYSVIVMESPAYFLSPISFSFTVGAGDYSSYTSNQTANQALLQTEVATLAQQFTIAWSMTVTPLTEQGGSGIILSSYGSAYFRNAIYGLQTMCPALFLLQSTDLDFTGRTWDYSFATLLQNTFAGTWIYDDVLAGFGGIWSVPITTSTGFISFIAAVIIFCLSVGLSKDSPQSVQGAFLDGVTVLIFCTLSGLFSAILNALMAFIFVIVGTWILLMNRA